MTIPQEAIEAGAQALFEESQELDQENSWDDELPEEWREAWRYAAQSALTAALPALERQIREQVAQEIEAAQFKVESVHHIHGTKCLCGFDSSGRSRSATEHITQSLNAAKIARGKDKS